MTATLTELTSALEQTLSQISMVTANYGESPVLAAVIQDWFHFLGGKPGEVVVIDCGSDAETQTICWAMFRDKLIDKLQIIHETSDDFGKDKGYIKEYTAGAIASKPYILFFKTDTLPYRKGHENWLVEAIQYLEREDIFAVGGSYNGPCKAEDAWDGWYFSRFCSYNFAIMKRDTFVAAMHEFANDFILSGFRSKNPLDSDGDGRFLIEAAFEQYMEQHNLYTLMKVEDINWSVFHTNVHGEHLKKTREKYLARKDVKKYLNSGIGTYEHNPDKGKYYGQPGPSLLKRLRIAFGKSALGPFWRSVKQALKPTRIIFGQSALGPSWRSIKQMARNQWGAFKQILRPVRVAFGQSVLGSSWRSLKQKLFGRLR